MSVATERRHTFITVFVLAEEQLEALGADRVRVVVEEVHCQTFVKSVKLYAVSAQLIQSGIAHLCNIESVVHAAQNDSINFSVHCV